MQKYYFLLIYSDHVTHFIKSRQSMASYLASSLTSSYDVTTSGRHLSSPHHFAMMFQKQAARAAAVQRYDSTVRLIVAMNVYKRFFSNGSQLFYARKQLLLSARLSHRNSVCLSVRLSDGWISQKRCKLGSPNLYRRLPGRL